MQQHQQQPRALGAKSTSPHRPFTLVLITPPELHPPGSREFDAELRAVRALFDSPSPSSSSSSGAGLLERLHLRKPGADPQHVAAYLSALDPGHRARVVVHGAAVAASPLAAAIAPFAARGELLGVHYREADRAESARRGHAFWGEDDDRPMPLLRSSGYHSLAAALGAEAAAAAEAEAGDEGATDTAAPTPAPPSPSPEPWPAHAYLDYCFLSPVYDSISKSGYRSAGFLAPGPRREGLRRALARAPLPVLALGGVGAGRLAELREAGFAGAAVLGAVWGAAGDVVGAYWRLAEEAEEAGGEVR